MKTIITNEQRMKKVLRKAKMQNNMKVVSTFMLSKIFSILLVLLAPLFTSIHTQKRK